MSSIVGRFLNWGLTPLYTYLFVGGEYGIVSFLYSFTAVALVILNYGMETGFFRFANKSDEPERVYTTAMISVGVTSIAFIALFTVFLRPVADALTLPHHPEYVWLLGVTVAVDAFSNIPFAYLRYKQRPVRFAVIKFFNIGMTILLNLFFLLACPAIAKGSASWLVNWFYAPMGGEAFGVGWIFFANLLCTLMVLLALTPFMFRRKWSFDSTVWRQMLSYSWPLLILGIAGILSQNMGQLMIPYLFEGNEAAAREMVGLYGANIKIAIVMVMFIQAFRYAYEPFIFSHAKAQGEDRTQAYCDAMKYFCILSFLIFLGVMYFLPLLKYFIGPRFWPGLKVVPVMLVAEIFNGIFFNLSLWYKLTDRTRWGMYLSLILFGVMFGFNIWLIPLIGVPDGYMGAAWSALIAYFVVMVISYFVGRHYYPLPYPVRKICIYAAIAVVLYVFGESVETPSAMWVTYILRLFLLGLYGGAVYYLELRRPKRVLT